jgi:hypothetical protein
MWCSRPADSERQLASARRPRATAGARYSSQPKTSLAPRHFFCTIQPFEAETRTFYANDVNTESDDLDSQGMCFVHIISGMGMRDPCSVGLPHNP